MTAASVLITAGDTARGRFIAKAVCNEGEYQVKVLVDDPFSIEAQTAAEMGAMVVKGSLESLGRLWLATKGCRAVVCVVDPMDLDPQNGIETQKKIVKFARHCKELKQIKHFVLCTDFNLLTKKYNGDICKELSNIGFHFCHFVRLPSFCFEDFTERLSGMYQAVTQSSARIEVNLDAKRYFTTCCAEDAGNFVSSILHHPADHDTKKALMPNTTALTMKGYAQALSEATGYKVISCTTDQSSMEKEGRFPEGCGKQYGAIFDEINGTKNDSEKSGKDFERWAEDLKLAFRELFMKIRDMQALEDETKSHASQASELSTPKRIRPARPSTELVDQLRKVSPDASSMFLSNACKSIESMRLHRRLSSGHSRTPSFVQLGRVESKHKIEKGPATRTRTSSEVPTNETSNANSTLFNRSEINKADPGTLTPRSPRCPRKINLSSNPGTADKNKSNPKIAAQDSLASSFH